MPFEKDHRPHRVELLDGGEVDVVDDGVEEEGEMGCTLDAGIQEVSWGDAIKIVNVWL